MNERIGVKFRSHHIRARNRSISLTTLISVSLWKGFSCHWCKATVAFKTRYSEESINLLFLTFFCDSGGVAVKMGKESLNHAPTQVWWKFVLFSLWSHRRPCHSIWSGRGRKKTCA